MVICCLLLVLALDLLDVVDVALVVVVVLLSLLLPASLCWLSRAVVVLVVAIELPVEVVLPLSFVEKPGKIYKTKQPPLLWMCRQNQCDSEFYPRHVGKFLSTQAVPKRPSSLATNSPGLREAKASQSLPAPALAGSVMDSTSLSTESETPAASPSNLS